MCTAHLGLSLSLFYPRFFFFLKEWPYSGPTMCPYIVSEKTLIYSFSFSCQGCMFQQVILPKAELFFNGKKSGEILLQAILFSLLSSLLLKPSLMLSDSLIKLFLFLVTTGLEIGALVHVFIVKNCDFPLLLLFSTKLVDLLLLFILVASF